MNEYETKSFRNPVKFERVGTRDGPRFGPTEADFCLRFGLSVNRIFGWETEEALRRSRDCVRISHFFLGNAHTVVKGTKDRNSVFNSTSE